MTFFSSPPPFLLALIYPSLEVTKKRRSSPKKFFSPSPARFICRVNWAIERKKADREKKEWRGKNVRTGEFKNNFVKNLVVFSTIERPSRPTRANCKAKRRKSKICERRPAFTDSITKVRSEKHKEQCRNDIKSSRRMKNTWRFIQIRINADCQENALFSVVVVEGTYRERKRKDLSNCLAAFFLYPRRHISVAGWRWLTTLV